MEQKYRVMKHKLLSIVVAITLAVTTVLPTGWTPVTVMAEETAKSTVSFQNVSNDGGKDIISMTNERTFEVTVPVAEEQDPQALIDGGLQWSLNRESGICDKSEYPNQYLGGKLEDWKQYKKADPLFEIKEVVAVTENGAKAIKMTFSNKYLYGKKTTYQRNSILDYTGTYTLACATSKGKELASTKVRVNPYDDYRTTEEFANELAEAAVVANSRGGMYATVESLGKSTNGLNMPYIIIAKNKEVLDQWQALLSRAKNDPETVLKEIQEGKVKCQVPVLYSNVHADEIPAADGVMNFVWDLVNSSRTEKKTYKNLTGFTKEGEEKLATQRETRKQATSSLVKDFTSYLGAITPNDSKDTSGVVDLEKYYTVEDTQFDVDALLDEVFYILVPEENVDGRTHNTRTAGNGVDLNRDALFQTQNETQNMCSMIAKWNPVAFAEYHGFVSAFQVEPCSPPHEPNIEYDLFAKMGMEGGEALGVAAAANNASYNSYQIPLRDYLVDEGDGTVEWEEPWDDMSTNYTPQYALLHGTVAYTIEVPTATEECAVAVEYSMMGHSKQVADNRTTYLNNIVTNFKRGVNNEDVESIRDWYVDAKDNKGAEADIFRPRNKENNNFFPEYYVIPLDAEHQSNISAAHSMEAFFLRNGVQVSKLTKDTTVNGTSYKAGSIVINMHQAERNVANAALYQGVLITGWPTLYSEPITAFDKTRGFECDAIHTVGAFDGALINLTEAENISTSYTGKTTDAVVISNSGMQAVNAVNTLLAAGKIVGYIEEGKYKGDFAVSYEDFATVKDADILTAYGVSGTIKCKQLTQPTIYIAGAPSKATEGYVDYYAKRDNTYNFNRIAIAEQMNFKTTDKISEADIIYAYTQIDDEELDAVLEKVKAGTPIIMTNIGDIYPYGNDRNFIEEIFPAAAAKELKYEAGNWAFDWLTTVTYESSSMITDSYVADGDNIMYGLGGNYFVAIPSGAKALIKTTKDTPMEGFFQQSELDKFLGNIVAFEYQKENRDITVFADTLTNKMHQQDDYGYLSNAIYSKKLAKEITITGTEVVQPTVTPTVAPVVTPTPTTTPTPAPTKTPTTVKTATIKGEEVAKAKTSSAKKVKALLKKDKNNSNGVIATVRLKGKVSDYKKINIAVAGKAKIKTGSNVYLYRYNKGENKLELLPDSKYKVQKDGTITVNIQSNKSDYVVLTKKASSKISLSLTDQIKVSISRKAAKVSLPATIKQVSKFSKNPVKGMMEAKIGYASSNKKIATISKNGKITAKRTGKVKITVKVTLKNGKTKTVKKTVQVKK